MRTLSPASLPTIPSRHTPVLELLGLEARHFLAVLELGAIDVVHDVLLDENGRACPLVAGSGVDDDDVLRRDAPNDRWPVGMTRARGLARAGSAVLRKTAGLNSPGA